MLHIDDNHGKTPALPNPVHHPSRHHLAQGVRQAKGADDQAEIFLRPVKLLR